MKKHILILLFMINITCYAWPTWMLSDDQQAYIYWQGKDFKNALQVFKNKSWQALSAYKLGNYNLAKNILANASSTNDIYNLGNSYAMLGEYIKARDLYKDVLSKSPDDADAKYNYELMKKLIKQKNTNKIPPKNQQHNQQKQQNQQQDKKQNYKSNVKQEEQQANKQLLELIPDNIKGILRQQLWRDHILKQRELPNYD